MSEVAVDHVIFHAGQALDALASFFERVGFTLTPLGRHSSGSVNRLAILDTQYLELVGFEPGTPSTVRPEIQSLPLGLTGLAAADRPEHRRGSDPEGFMPARRLERPVDFPGLHGVASFTNTEVRAQAPDVRVFLCRHHTPELVWHPDWQRHANGVTGVREVGFASRDPQRLHAALRRVFDLAPGQDAACYDAAGTVVRVVPAGARAALLLRTRDPGATLQILKAAGIPHDVVDGSMIVPLPQPYATDLVFTAP